MDNAKKLQSMLDDGDADGLNPMNTDRPDCRKKIVLGFGDVFRGDYGAACYAVEAVNAEHAEHGAEAYYLSGEYRGATPYIVDAQTAAFVGTARIGAAPGAVYSWDLNAFRMLAAASSPCSRLRALSEELAKIEFCCGLPPRLRFIFIEPAQDKGVHLSLAARSAIRKASCLINTFLQEGQEDAATPNNVLRLRKLTLCGASA